MVMLLTLVSKVVVILNATEQMSVDRQVTQDRNQTGLPFSHVDDDNIQTQ